MIRDLFSDNLLTFFESQKNVCVEGGDDMLIFYRQGDRVKPNELQSFMQEGLAIFALLRSSNDT